MRWSAGGVSGFRSWDLWLAVSCGVGAFLMRGAGCTWNDITDREFDADNGLMKFNPLIEWTEKEVWEYIRTNDVPYNSLHERGFISIGCEPCTRPVLPNQHEREGRWWWEEATQKECGLHAGNLIAKI